MTSSTALSPDFISEINSPDANIDRHGHKRTVPLEVLSLAPPRTGTLSMQEAYRILGYPNPYHFASNMINVQDADIWRELLQAKLKDPARMASREELDQVLGHCGAVTDAPSAMLRRELVDAYPEAKVVLVERDEDAWFRSMSVILENCLSPFVVYVLRFTDPGYCGRIFGLSLDWIEVWFGTTSLKQAKQVAKERYRAHNAAIKAQVPKERLLQYRLGTGWEPLCKFLGKPVPKDVPFPHRNESKTLQSAMEALIAKSLKRSAVNVGCVVGVVALSVGVGMRMLG